MQNRRCRAYGLRRSCIRASMPHHCVPVLQSSGGRATHRRRDRRQVVVQTTSPWVQAREHTRLTEDNLAVPNCSGARDAGYPSIGQQSTEPLPARWELKQGPVKWQPARPSAPLHQGSTNNCQEALSCKQGRIGESSATTAILATTKSVKSQGSRWPD